MRWVRAMEAGRGVKTVSITAPDMLRQVTSAAAAAGRASLRAADAGPRRGSPLTTLNTCTQTHTLTPPPPTLRARSSRACRTAAPACWWTRARSSTPRWSRCWGGPTRGAALSALCCCPCTGAPVSADARVVLPSACAGERKPRTRLALTIPSQNPSRAPAQARLRACCAPGRPRGGRVPGLPAVPRHAPAQPDVPARGAQGGDNARRPAVRARP